MEKCITGLIPRKKGDISSSQFNAYLIASILFGIITTIKTYVGFGWGNHIEQLPLILRSFNSSYLGNDFFVNEGIQSIARQNYLSLITMLASREESLPLLFLILTFISNISISVITFLIGYKLFNHSILVGALASALVMSVFTFSLGRGGTLFQSMLLPSTLAYPLVLASYYFVLNNKLLIAIVLCCLSSLIHPLIGLETGVILFVIFFSSQWFLKPKKQNHKKNIAAVLIFLIFVVISMVPQIKQEKIDPNLYIYILAFFRHPHHYIPSSFSIYSYISAFLFLSSVLIIYRQHSDRNPQMSLKVIILLSILFCLFFGGYLFVEIIPIKTLVIAQTFRLTYIFQWISLIIISGFMITKSRTCFSKTIFALSASHPASLFTGAVLHSVSNSTYISKILSKKTIQQGINFVTLFILIIVTFYQSKSHIDLLVLYLLIQFFLKTTSKESSYKRALLIIAVILSAGVLLDYTPLRKWNPVPLTQLANRSNNIKSELDVHGNEVVEFVKKETPEDALFLTPHDWGQFRIKAKRAIVVDSKAFPFTNKAVLEWYRRIEYCYGPADPKGAMNHTNGIKSYHKVQEQMSKNYTRLTDQKLKNISDRYKLSYAVLFEETETEFRILFENAKYKVICFDQTCSNSEKEYK